MFTLMAQVMAQNGYIQAFTLHNDPSDIDFAFARLEGLFQQLRLINPGNSRLLHAWTMLDQQVRPNLRRLLFNATQTDTATLEGTLTALQEKVGYAVALLSWV